MQIRTLRLSVKAVGDDDGNGEFEAVLSTKSTDRDGESIAPGAFEPLPASIPLYHHHDWMQKALPVGRAEPFYDGDVLKAKGVFASTPRAQEIRTLVTEGVIDAMSVGYLVGKADKKTITSGDLFEASFTAIPSNAEAAITAAKAIGGLTIEVSGDERTVDAVRADLQDKGIDDAEVKAGARNNASDSGRLQQIHDLSVENGADCSGAKALTKAITGSMEDRQENLRLALVEANADALAEAYPSDDDDRAWRLHIVATFDDSVVYRIGWSDEETAWSVGYSFDGDTATISGTPERVVVEQIIRPASEDEGEAETPMSKSVAAPAEAGAATDEPGEAAPEDEEWAAELDARLIAIDAAVMAATS